MIDTISIENRPSIKPGPMVTAPPAQTVDDAAHADFAAGSGFNSPLLADLLSSYAMHERCGIALFRALAALTNNLGLAPKFGRFVAETQSAVAAWEQLITSLGGDPAYISPSVRLTQAMDGKLLESFLLSGSADALELELAAAQAATVATRLCVTNAMVLARLAQEADPGPAKNALTAAAGVLLPMSEEHLDWASSHTTELALTQAKHPVVQKVVRTTEKVTAKVKDALTP